MYAKWLKLYPSALCIVNLYHPANFKYIGTAVVKFHFFNQILKKKNMNNCAFMVALCCEMI